MSYQLLIWSAKIESVSLWVTTLKHVENRPEFESSGPLNTQHNGKRTATGVFYRFQKTPTGGYSGTHPNQGSLLHLHNCSSEESALSADIGLVVNRNQLLRFQRLGLSSHTVWPQKPDKKHPNEPVSTSTRQFACQCSDVS